MNPYRAPAPPEPRTPTDRERTIELLCHTRVAYFDAEATLRLRPAPHCSQCGARIDGAPVSVTDEHNGTMTRAETCGGLCALRWRANG